MGISLTEAAKLTQDQLRRGVIETITEDSFLMQNLPFIEVNGAAYVVTSEASLGGAAFRDVNAGYTASEGSYAQKSVVLKRLGGDADLDQFIAQTYGGVVADQRASLTAMKAKAVRLTFHAAFINGNSASNPQEFDGLNKQLTGGAQEIVAATNGLPVVGASSDDRQAFFDKIDEVLASLDGQASALVMNGPVLAKFKSAARRESAYDETRDAFGKTVVSYQGVPLINIGNDASGAAIIPQTETEGSASNASSIYAVRFGDDGVAGLTNGGVQVKDLGEVNDKPVLRTRIEFYVALAIHAPKSAAVLRGVLAS